MRTAAIRVVMVLAVLVGPAAAIAAPPARPLPMTSAQYQAVCQLEAQPEHVAVLDVRASYTSEHEATVAANLAVNDATTAAFNFGWPSIPLILLIAAAPL